MKKKQIIYCLIILTISLSLGSCLKDKGTKRYYSYTPIYMTSVEVRNNIKSDVPQPIKSAGKMCILGNTIYLVELEKGIHIIDNSNPSNPVNKAFISIPGNEDVAVKGHILYADCYTDILAIDITNPHKVTLKSFLPNILPDRSYINGFSIQQGFVIKDWKVEEVNEDVQITDGQGIWRNGSYVSTVNYTNPGGIFYMALSSSNKASSVGGSMNRLAIVNDYLYLVTSNYLNAISISNPESPSFLNFKNLHLGIGSAETIYPFKDQLFIGSTSGMYIFSISTPDNPSLLTTFTHANACDPVITDGTNAFITLHSGSFCGGVDNELDVVNVQDLLHPAFVKKYPLTHPNGLSKDGNTLFVCDGTEGLKVFDATDVNNLILRQTIALPTAFDIICLNGIAIVAANDGIYQFDYSNLSNIKQISKITVSK